MLRIAKRLPEHRNPALLHLRIRRIVHHLLTMHTLTFASVGDDMARLLKVVGISATALLFCTAAHAAGVSEQNRSTAVVGAYGGYINSDLTNSGINQMFPNDDVPLLDAEAFLVGIDAFWNGWHGDTIATQLDFNAQATSALAYDPADPTSGQWINGAVHVAYRNPEQFAVGAFGAAQRSAYGYDALGMALVGVEGQAYLDDLTIYLQGGVTYTSPAEPGFYNYRDYGSFAFVRGVLRYFLTDNLKISAEGTYGEGEIGYYTFSGQNGNDPEHEGATVPGKFAMARLGVDYRPDDGDASFFAAYEASYLTQSWDGVTRSSLNQRVLAGIKVDFGADTLKSRDREGVTWDVPNVVGAVGQSAQSEFCFISECYYPLDPTP